MQVVQMQQVTTPNQSNFTHQAAPPVNQVPIIVNQQSGTHPAFKYRKGFLCVGAIQLALGTISFILGIVCVSGSFSYTVNAYTGFWNGAWLIAAGILGLVAWKSPNSCAVVSGMVVTILCALSCFSSGITESALAAAGRCFYYTNCVSGYQAVHGILAFLAFFGFVVTIIHSAMCCGATCCSTAQQPPSTTTFITTTTTGQAPVVAYQQQNLYPNQQFMPASTSIPGHPSVVTQPPPGGLAPTAEQQFEQLPPKYEN